MKNYNGMWLPDGDTFFQNRPDYEGHDYSILKPYLNQRRVAVDIGAHVGYWSRRLVNDFEYVYAFEAELEHAQCLKLNVEADNFEMHNIAVSDRLGTVNFTRNIDNSGMSHVSDQGEEIFCQRLDHWHLENLDLIKIDVEGHELQVLQGAAANILRNRPVLFVEILNSTPYATRKAILDLMLECKYVLKETIAENYNFVCNNDHN